jgi:MFS family permease
MPYLRKTTQSQVSSVFGLFAIFTFFVYLGDAVMSYVTPVFLSNNISDPLIAGIVFAFSSLIGLIFNFIAGEFLGSKSTSFFLKATVFMALAFPLAFIVAPTSLVGYLVGLAAWGIYYETQAFASFKFIEITRKKEEYSEAWGFLGTVTSLAYFIGPLIATFVIDYFFDLNFYIAIGCYLLAYVILLVLRSHKQIKAKVNYVTKPVTPLIEFKRWGLFMKTLWPLWTFGLFMYLVESFFWTIGIVYAENLKSESELSGFMLSIHVIPTILVGLIMSRIRIKNGKKRLSLITAIIASVILSRFASGDNIYQILGIVAGYSLFSAIAFNLLWATYEDYVGRVDVYENDLIGLEQSASSFAYIIGPIIAGLLASLVGEAQAMSYAGMALLAISIVIFAVIPRKIHIPHKSFQSIR